MEADASTDEVKSEIESLETGNVVEFTANVNDVESQVTAVKMKMVQLPIQQMWTVQNKQYILFYKKMVPLPILQILILFQYKLLRDIKQLYKILIPLKFKIQVL